MKKAITITILFVSLFSNNLFAKGWYKTCKGVATQKQDANRFYVGGKVNKNHLHVGSDFIAITSDNNNSKPVTSGIANCISLNQALSDVDDGGYASPGDVTTCLNAAIADYCQ